MHKFTVHVSGNMTIWADTSQGAFDRAHQVCGFLEDHCNTETNTTILPSDGEGVEKVELTIDRVV